MKFIRTMAGYVNVATIGAFHISEATVIGKGKDKAKQFILRCDFRDGVADLAAYDTHEEAVAAMEKLVGELTAD